MTRPHALRRLLHSMLLVSLLLSTITPAFAQDTIFLPLVTNGLSTPPKQVSNLLFRTRITVTTPAQWQELAALQVLFLAQGENWALALVDDSQLATLARLRYNPAQTNALETLAASSGALSADFAPLLAQLPSLQSELAAGQRTTSDKDALRQQLRTTLQALSAAQIATLAQATTVDTDGDGLTDDQESWWCTEPTRADSDFDNTSDGAEVAALRAWLNNQRATFPSTGKPFQGWPPQRANCYDDDQDAVPDLAESLDLGLNPNRESTDRDKFDDGQELFGLTYCTGQGGFCSYGPLPRNEDWGVIFAEMPSWVKAPGNHPLVAAFPVPEVDVVESSLKVATVTVVTTDHVISEGTEKSYSTAKTEGTETSVTDTKMWNEWMEISDSTTSSNVMLYSAAETAAEWSWKQTGSFTLGTLKFVGATGGAIAGCGLGTAASVVTVGVASPLGIALCAASIAGAAATAYDAGKDFKDAFWPDESQEQTKTNQYQSTENRLENSSDNVGNANANENVVNTQAYAPNSTAINYAGTQFTASSEQLSSKQLYEITSALLAPRYTHTETQGQSWGGSQSTTNTIYQEHTVTNGEAFSNEESWGTATAVNSAHAANLTFTYKVRNTGTEYAREIRHLAFNIYIGDDPNPACTYFLGTNQCGVPAGEGIQFANFMPSEEHAFTSAPIPLSLEQMKIIDLGGPIRIVVEDFTYGIDELFYQDAANAGVLIAIEDGTDDRNEAIDTYLIPTWGTETVLNVLKRYFPHETDINGTVTAIWTPEYLNSNPSWCQSPRRPSDQPTKVVWCKHVLSTADWWNVYSEGLGDGSEGFQSTNATPGATALFRFNKDSDLDGFSDRSEARLGTDPMDATSFPRPELLAGLHKMMAGNQVTATLSLLNTGIYDAYGVEAVMVAPNDSVSITNNTVGGSGRVKALKQVIVGSHLQLVPLSNSPWNGANDHAVPAVGGYYTGDKDRLYTFTVDGCAGSCMVGNGNWDLIWNDGSGKSGRLAFGTGYQSPTFQAVGEYGLTVALYSGAANSGESFTVRATTPRDTFQYTINREPHTAPLVIVSYNDPQGNHRFVLPSAAMALDTPTDNLQRFAGQMRHDVGVELVTQQPFDAANDPQGSLSLLVNNPADSTLTDAHLFVELIDITGTVVAEIRTDVTLPPGPTSTPVTFDSRTFDPPYQMHEDYIVLAFLTDYQGNILDTAGRPLSSFQVDPQPALAAASSALSWDFGTVEQGTLLRHDLALANAGYGHLYTYLPPTPGLLLSGSGQRTLSAADTSHDAVQLDTLALPIGPYSQTVTLHSSDPQQPALTLSIQGTVIAGTPDIPAGALQRPLDVAAMVTGTHSQGEWITYTHTLGPDAETLHPVKIYSQDYTKLWGVGKVATPFGQGTAAAIFGTGADGDKVISGDVLFDGQHTPLGEGTVAAGSTVFTLVNMPGFIVGTEILLHQTQGDTAGTYEFARIVAVNGNQVTVNSPLAHTFVQSGSNKAQAVVVPNYHNVTVTATGRLRAPNWNGASGGIIALRASGDIVVETGGVIDASWRGYRGGTLNCVGCSSGNQGESYGGLGGKSTQNFYSGGGGGQSDPSPSGGSGDASGGGGGGHGTVGTPGASGRNTAGGAPGTAVGSNVPTRLFFGGGGGAGGAGDNWGRDGGIGGNGGGLAIISAEHLTINGTLIAGGQNGTHGEAAGGGGGGAGGALYLMGSAIQIGSNTVTAAGGLAGTGSDAAGGNGGSGRIYIDYCNTLDGTTSPAAVTQQIDCYIADQSLTAAGVTAQGTASLDMFGDGRDGNITVAGNQTYLVNEIKTGVVSTAFSNTHLIPVEETTGFAIGDLILIHQSRGHPPVGEETGHHEWHTIAGFATETYAGSPGIIIDQTLFTNYLDGGSWQAQVIKVPQYHNVTIEAGAILSSPPWDGNTGGLLTMRVNNDLMLKSGGTISMQGKGYRGGYASTASSTGVQGEGHIGEGTVSTRRNGNGGGGGEGGNDTVHGEPGSGGGGGGHSDVGQNGWSNSLHTQGGQGGGIVGDELLKTLFFGGGGGQGGGEKGTTGSRGGNGGGIITINAANVQLTGTIDAQGSLGQDSTYPANSGAGGAGGTVKVLSQHIAYSGNVVVTGAGHGTMHSNPGFGESGSGGNGRIRIEYCDSLTGTTNPPASTQKLDCYSTEQTAPSVFRLNLPESFTDGRTYHVQFGRKLDFAAAGEQLTTLRIPAGMVSSAYLDALVSGLPANATLAVDIGNDGTAEFSATVGNNSTNQTANLSAALTTYWRTHGAPPAGTLDVPVKVTMNQPGQVLLTNLQVQTTASQLRRLRLPVDNYTTFALDFTLDAAANVAVDLGDNGSIDWSSDLITLRQETGNLASALNGYLAGQSGRLDVPVRFYLNPEATVTLQGYQVTRNHKADLVAQQLQVNPTLPLGAAAATNTILEGDHVPVSGTVYNGGTLDSGPLTAAFFAEAAGWGDWYVGSVFIDNLPAGASTTVETIWNTTGFSGTVPVKVVVNPYGRIAESNYTNNQRSTTTVVNAYAQGDLNGDRSTNILDLQRLINMILSETQPDSTLYPSAEWSRGDLTGDAEWNILDLQRLINLILAETE